MIYNDIAVFVKVVSSGSLSAAARQLELTKSTVSRRLSVLEESMAVRLLERNTRALRLTESGRILYERCRPLLDKMSEARDATTGTDGLPTGLLRVSAPVSFGHHIMSRWLLEFAALYPSIQLDIILDNENLDLLKDEIDLTLRVGPLEDSSLIAIPLWAKGFYVVASPVYLENHGSPCTPYDLANHNCIILKPSPANGWQFRDEQGALFRVPVSGSIACNDIRTASLAVQMGHGIGFLPELAVGHNIEQGQLVSLLMKWLPEPRRFYLVYPSNRFLSTKVRYLIDFIRAKGEPVQSWPL